MNRIEKYKYDEFKKDLPRYVVYIVDDKNNKFNEILRTKDKSKKEILTILEKKYKNLNNKSFFIVFKFGFHTGMKPLQGGPLSITMSTLVFNDANKLVSGYTKDKKYQPFHRKVWFQRKWLNVNGWSDDYLDCMMEGLLSGKVELLPLVVNMFNVYFKDICEKRKKNKTSKKKNNDFNNELKDLIKQFNETKINKPIDTKEIEDKFKLIESFSKPNNKINNEINNYLIKLKKTFDDNDNYYQAYKIKNNKIILVGNASTKIELNKLIDENLPELIKEDIKYIVKITYNISIKNFLNGPISITAIIQEINKGKLTKKNMKVNTVYYTIDELQHRKLLKNDFKLLVNGLLNNTIDSNLLKIYTISDIITDKQETKPTNKTNSIDDVINLMNEVKRTKINNKIDKNEINKLIEQLERKKEETPITLKRKNSKDEYALSEWLENNNHLFSNRF
jgi:hypothetical protein